MRYAIVTLLLLLAHTFACAQSPTVFWATRLEGFSSEYGERQFSAKQVLGEPEVWPLGRENPCAWSPKWAEGSATEYVEVSFERPIWARQVVVSESAGAGCITSIELTDAFGNVIKLKEPWETPIDRNWGRWLSVPLPPLQDAIVRVRVNLNPALVEGYNHIDAIGLSESNAAVVPEVLLANDIVFSEAPEALNPAVNSEYDEIMPVISPAGSRLYFDRKDHPDNVGDVQNDDIWYAEPDPSGEWTRVVHIGAPLNTRGHNFLLSLRGDGKTALLGNCYEENGFMVTGLSRSHLQNGTWSAPECLTITNYSNNNKFAEFSMSPDGKYLVMAIERSGSEGAKDLYVSIQEGNQYSEPKHLGPTVNSPATEMSPFLAADGKTLFFASDGFRGYGNKDIFVSRRLDESWTRWSVPQNLGPIINNENWNAYFSVPASGDYGYYCSDSRSSKKSDIFRIKLPEAVRPIASVVLQLQVQDLANGKPLLASVRCHPVGQPGIATLLDVGKLGVETLILDMGLQWEIIVESEGYATETQTIDLRGQLDRDVMKLVCQMRRL